VTSTDTYTFFAWRAAVGTEGICHFQASLRSEKKKIKTPYVETMTVLASLDDPESSIKMFAGFS
jgi:hypothetical protein